MNATPTADQAPCTSRRRACIVTAALAVSATFASCGGVPLRSLPRLARLQGALLEMDPAEFALAIQMDARMLPAVDAVPVMHLSLRPASEGQFEPLDRRLPMTAAQGGESIANLASAAAGRKWLVYRFAEASQAELRVLQQRFKALRDQGKGRGGSLSIGIAQAGVAARDPRLEATRWESWLQTSRSEGYFELWSGTVAELLRSAGPGR